MTLLQTLRYIKSDHVQMARLMGIRLFPVGILFTLITPSIVALTLHRFAHYFHTKGLRKVSWPIWIFNQYITGVDILPSSEIGESCYIGHPSGTIISGKIGKNAMFFGAPVIGGGMGRGDIGAGEGLPVIADNVVIGIRATILGPIRIGNNVKIGAGALVINDVPDGLTMVSVHKPSYKAAAGGIDYEEIAGLKSRSDLPSRQSENTLEERAHETK
jgi:serine acetyltransferase